MKKLFLILLVSLFVVTGCSSSMNTPTKAVENFLSKYQNLDSEVTTQLDQVISSDVSMDDKQKSDFRDLMLNQYKNLSFKVINETVAEDEAEVDVEIEVLDYASNINESRIYYRNHLDEFSETSEDIDNDQVPQKDNVVEDAIDDISSFIEYKIKNMKNVTNKSKQTITFYLSKIDNEWVVDDLSDLDLEKLHGLYEG